MKSGMEHLQVLMSSLSRKTTIESSQSLLILTQMQFPKKALKFVARDTFSFCCIFFFIALFMISLFKRHLIFQVKGSIQIRILILLSWKNSTTVFNILNMVFLQPYQYIKEPHTTLKIEHSLRFFNIHCSFLHCLNLMGFLKKKKNNFSVEFG